MGLLKKLDQFKKQRESSESTSDVDPQQMEQNLKLLENKVATEKMLVTSHALMVSLDQNHMKILYSKEKPRCPSVWTAEKKKVHNSSFQSYSFSRAQPGKVRSEEISRFSYQRAPALDFSGSGP
jgi:hypothetical protein